MPMTGREVIRLIEKNGWVEMRSIQVSRAGVGGKELAPGTLNAKLKKAGPK
jgi:hypothetical protein